MAAVQTLRVHPGRAARQEAEEGAPQRDTTERRTLLCERLAALGAQPRAHGCPQRALGISCVGTCALCRRCGRHRAEAREARGAACARGARGRRSASHRQKSRSSSHAPASAAGSAPSMALSSKLPQPRLGAGCGCEAGGRATRRRSGGCDVMSSRAVHQCGPLATRHGSWGRAPPLGQLPIQDVCVWRSPRARRGRGCASHRIAQRRPNTNKRVRVYVACPPGLSSDAPRRAVSGGGGAAPLRRVIASNPSLYAKKKELGFRCSTDTGGAAVGSTP